MNNGLCNEISGTSTLSRNPCLRSIEIGSECFSYTSSFLIERVPHLESIVVGENSFTKHKGATWGSSDADSLNIKSRSLHIISCPQLKEFIIGSFSFSDFGGGLTLTSND